MNILKKGVRFVSQDTNTPISQKEIPFILEKLTPMGLRRAALVSLILMKNLGMTLNQALDILDDKPEEKH
jgi:hypothetical protein